MLRLRGIAAIDEKQVRLVRGLGARLQKLQRHEGVQRRHLAGGESESTELIVSENRAHFEAQELMESGVPDP